MSGVLPRDDCICVWIMFLGLSSSDRANMTLYSIVAKSPCGYHRNVFTLGSCLDGVSVVFTYHLILKLHFTWPYVTSIRMVSLSTSGHSILLATVAYIFVWILIVNTLDKCTFGLAILFMCRIRCRASPELYETALWTVCDKATIYLPWQQMTHRARHLYQHSINKTTRTTHGFLGPVCQILPWTNQSCSYMMKSKPGPTCQIIPVFPRLEMAGILESARLFDTLLGGQE